MYGLNSYDRIAAVYDRLAGIVFGSAIRDAQRLHLGALKNAHEVLIVGGGTGWLLADVLSLHPQVRVTYVEASERMIGLARKQISDADRPRVDFIHSTHEMLSQPAAFDAVIINFFVDMFTTDALAEIIARLNVVLRREGQLLCTDFVDDRGWQRMFLKVMYGFFRLATGLRNQRLAPWRKIIADSGFELVESSLFWSGFICSQRFRKISQNSRIGRR
jgi:ubiquinone/menaquinone biosynthesis C-methylase UbiE